MKYPVIVVKIVQRIRFIVAFFDKLSYRNETKLNEYVQLRHDLEDGKEKNKRTCLMGYAFAVNILKTFSRFRRKPT